MMNNHTEIIKVLWDLLDDIDTASDMFKTNNEGYRKYVEKKQKQRWETGIDTDGYTLDLPKSSGAKTLDNSDADDATKNVPDIKFFGNGDTFRLICKASSDNEGWMKSTKGLDFGGGMALQVSTQQRNPDGSYVLAEALTFVPGACLGDILPAANDDGTADEDPRDNVIQDVRNLALKATSEGSSFTQESLDRVMSKIISRIDELNPGFSEGE